MYGCDRMVLCDPTHVEEAVVQAYWDMTASVQVRGEPVEKMVIEITKDENFAVIGWRVYEKATTA